MAALAAPASLSAAPVSFVNPVDVPGGWNRGVSDSTYQEWDGFTGVTDQAPDVGVFSPGSPLISELSGGGFATGGGNIYSPSGPSSFDAIVPNYGLGAGYTTTVLLQTRTLGLEIAPETVLINGAAPTSVEELDRVTIPNQGDNVETLWRWDLPGNDSSYTVEFDAAVAHMSLDAVAIDTIARAVPEPATVGLLAFGAAALGLAARTGRRRRPTEAS